jgi:hypothetical protein
MLRPRSSSQGFQHEKVQLCHYRLVFRFCSYRTFQFAHPVFEVLVRDRRQVESVRTPTLRA